MSFVVFPLKLEYHSWNQTIVFLFFLFFFLKSGYQLKIWYCCLLSTIAGKETRIRCKLKLSSMFVQGYTRHILFSLHYEIIEIASIFCFHFIHSSSIYQKSWLLIVLIHCLLTCHQELAILCLNRLKRVIQYYLPLKQYMVQLLPSHCQPQL